MLETTVDTFIVIKEMQSAKIVTLVHDVLIQTGFVLEYGWNEEILIENLLAGNADRDLRYRFSI